MIRCSPCGAAALGITSTEEPAIAAAPAGCGCSGTKHGPGLSFVLGALVGGLIILAIRA